MKQIIEIVDVLGREILDSRGNPTVEVEVYLDKPVVTTCIIESVSGYALFTTSYNDPSALLFSYSQETYSSSYPSYPFFCSSSDKNAFDKYMSEVITIRFPCSRSCVNTCCINGLA